jgi:hypothetical protein
MKGVVVVEGTVLELVSLEFCRDISEPTSRLNLTISALSLIFGCNLQ